MPRPVFRSLTLILLLITSVLALPAGGAPFASAAEPDADSATAEVHGLKGEYFRASAPGAHDFAHLGGITLDPNIDLPGLAATFESLTGRTEHTTARWTGRITAPETGDYTFSAIGDNGFRLFVDDQPVIDHWVGDWDVEQHSAPVRLIAGERHDFRLEMFQDVGGANMFLRWSSASIAKQIVPESAFTPPDGFEVYPVGLTVAEDGLRVVADFEDAVTAVAEAAGHLTVEADTTPMPIGSVAVAPDDSSRLVVTLTAPVQRGQRVRFSYDGSGGLAVGGEAVPQIVRNAANSSTHRLRTEWADDVDAEHPLPEYPRPQQVREKWLNLNGPWEFAGAHEGEQPRFGQPLAERIVVPFPVESQLSGLERHEDHMFYRRLVTVPAGWRIGSGQRLRLNFGAVDHHARVWVNGRQVAEHVGGYTEFSADITDALRRSGQQEIVVAVTDTTGPNQPVGKQSSNPGGIVYTESSGIWQTVWLEPVPVTAIDDVRSTPNLATSSLAVEVRSTSASPSARVTATARDSRGRKVGSVSGPANAPLNLPVPRPHLWSPDDPYLYDLDVVLTDGRSRDSVGSYFGMRSIAVQEVGGFPKLVLNGKPIFSLAMLDQGFFPDGLYTAPTDEALRFDLQAQKDLGFNAVRKHIKVEPARWYHHADQLGLLVWQDFVSGDITNEQGQQAFLTEGRRTMEQLHDSPSIIGWVVFNEGWGEWDREATGQIAESVKAADPSRITNAHSGVNCCNSKGDSGKGDVIDHHDYLNTDAPYPDATRVAMDGEHGGFTLRTPGHMWPGTPAAIYSGVADKAALTAKYVENTRTFYLDAAGAELSGSVYTQVTDLENELNGLWTYDRREIKVDPAPVREINRQVVAAGARAGEDATFPGRGHWPLDEGRELVGRDRSGGGSDVALSGNTSWVSGISGSALHFDGDGDFAQTGRPVLDTRGDYTVSAWVTLDALPGNYATAVSQDGRVTENPFYLQYGRGTFAFSTPGGHRATLAVTPELGRWYHLVGVRDHASGEARLYLDGQRVGTAQAGPDVVSTGPLTIGRAKYAGQSTDHWSGSIDQVRAVGRALSDQEVADLHGSDRR
ncbi:LamG-like jellyroll fold domain-containing protein [Umezawaea beigongshangensis]|uniref:LamG-like jellyroll fold domain-containing protein n=1 Tax=Umezawaea beigongshangensis TaxID=2780383 RepID=UPI0018F1EBB9|nr:LamG-like jellyroll fold domain-containing protein [Umezawaea beigongshangensis]